MKTLVSTYEIFKRNLELLSTYHLISHKGANKVVMCQLMVYEDINYHTERYMLVDEFKLCNIVLYDGMWAHVLKYWFKCWHTDSQITRIFHISALEFMLCTAIPYVDIWFHAAKCCFIFLQMFYMHQNCLICLHKSSNFEILVSMLTFDFKRWNVDSYVDI